MSILSHSGSGGQLPFVSASTNNPTWAACLGGLCFNHSTMLSLLTLHQVLFCFGLHKLDYTMQFALKSKDTDICDLVNITELPPLLLLHPHHVVHVSVYTTALVNIAFWRWENFKNMMISNFISSVSILYLHLRIPLATSSCLFSHASHTVSRLFGYLIRLIEQ